jgi:hypothetical protein
VNPFEGLTRLFTSRVDGIAPMDDKFVRPDREATAKSMRLEVRGREQGELNLPSADAQDFDLVEREIVAAVAEHLDSAHIDTSQNLRSYEDRLSDLHLLHGIGAIRGETQKTLGDLRSLVAEWHDRLATKRDAVRGSYKELRDFQEKNGLTRPFHKVESRWVHGSVILMAWLAEAAGNTIFLSENNPMGIAGGVVAAAFVAAINVALAVSAGVFAFRGTNLPRPTSKALAWISLGLWFIVTSNWNLGAGHFREAQAAGVADPQMAAFTLVANHPIQFASFYSWGMLIVGLLAAFVSAHEGYKMNDPFPGYGTLGLQHTDRCAEYADLVAEARENLAEQRDRAIEAAQAIKDQLGIQLRERGRIHAAHAHLMRRFNEHHGRMEELTNYLLQIYRNANIRARTDKPPKHFDQPFTFARQVLPALHEQEIDKAKIESAEVTLNKGIDAVAEAFDRSIDSFTPLEQLKKGLEDGAL